MLDQINTVLGAVATKDIVPVLTHIYLSPEGLQGSNGRISIHYPHRTPVDREVCLPGRKLQQALKRGQDHKWTLSEHNLTITTGKLRVRLPLNPAPYPLTDPSAGDPVPIPDPTKFIDTLRFLRPFVAKDGSKPWACGILVSGDAMYATNNVVLTRMIWAKGLDILPVNIPMDAVDEIVRLWQAGHVPYDIRVDDNSMTVQCDTGVWLRTTLLSSQWPDVDAIVDSGRKGDPYTDPVVRDLWDGLQAVVPFSADERAPVVEFTPEGMQTREGDLQAHLEMEGLPPGAYRAEVLSDVLNVADKVWFDDYPDPVHFSGEDDFAGVMVGVRA